MMNTRSSRRGPASSAKMSRSNPDFMIHTMAGSQQQPHGSYTRDPNTTAPSRSLASSTFSLDGRGGPVTGMNTPYQVYGLKEGSRRKKIHGHGRGEGWLVAIVLVNVISSLALVTLPMFAVVYWPSGEECLLYISLKGQHLVYGNPISCNLVGYTHIVVFIVGLIFFMLLALKKCCSGEEEEDDDPRRHMRSYMDNTANRPSSVASYASNLSTSTTVTIIPEDSMSQMIRNCSSLIFVCVILVMVTLAIAILDVVGYVESCREIHYEMQNYFRFSQTVVGAPIHNLRVTCSSLFRRTDFHSKFQLYRDFRHNDPLLATTAASAWSRASSRYYGNSYHPYTSYSYPHSGFNNFYPSSLATHTHWIPVATALEMTVAGCVSTAVLWILTLAFLLYIRAQTPSRPSRSTKKEYHDEREMMRLMPNSMNSTFQEFSRGGRGEFEPPQTSRPPLPLPQQQQQQRTLQSQNMAPMVRLRNEQNPQSQSNNTLLFHQRPSSSSLISTTFDVNPTNSQNHMFTSSAVNVPLVQRVNNVGISNSVSRPETPMQTRRMTMMEGHLPAEMQPHIPTRSTSLRFSRNRQGMMMVDGEADRENHIYDEGEIWHSSPGNDEQTAGGFHQTMDRPPQPFIPPQQQQLYQEEQNFPVQEERRRLPAVFHSSNAQWHQLEKLNNEFGMKCSQI